MRAPVKRLFLFAALILGVFALLPQDSRGDVVITPGFRPSATIQQTLPEGYPSLIVAGGCFWCIESEFRRIEGVLFTRSGYAGGDIPNPSYEQVTSSNTGHREATEITFDPSKVSSRDLIHHFMTQAHDPTQTDGQGPDIGFHYTSAIYYQDDTQKKVAEDLLREYEKNKTFKKPVATKLEAYKNFYAAETYHQQYYEKYEKQTGERHMKLWLRQQKENARNLFSGDK
jgi:peptide-methionine (S)-S-oxide reductase